jgi:hypothetical protein
MQLCEQQYRQQTIPFPHGGEPENLPGASRQEMDRLIALGDEAIRRALDSSDSEKFLRMARQPTCE